MGVLACPILHHPKWGPQTCHSAPLVRLVPLVVLACHTALGQLREIAESGALSLPRAFTALMCPPKPIRNVDVSNLCQALECQFLRY